MKKLLFIFMFILGVCLQWDGKGLSVGSNLPKAMTWWGDENDGFGSDYCSKCSPFSCTCEDVCCEYYPNCFCDIDNLCDICFSSPCICYNNICSICWQSPCICGNNIWLPEFEFSVCRYCGAQVSYGQLCTSCCRGAYCGCCAGCGNAGCGCVHCGSLYCLGDCICWCGARKPCPYHSGDGGYVDPGLPPGGYDPLGGGGNSGGGSNPPPPPPPPVTPPPPKEPCSDLVNNKANPLVDMALEPPNPSNIAGGTYGYTRIDKYGKSKFHNGIDLAGMVGTPIYAQFDGTVGKVVSEQPNRVDGFYPVGYDGDVDHAGNRIYINSTVNGNTVNIGYWHLQAGTPIAINPQTGKPWQTGDVVKAGALIGYIGITGNSSPNLPHLHLTTQVNGVRTDPATYLEATVSTKTTTITTPCD